MPISRETTPAGSMSKHGAGSVLDVVQLAVFAGNMRPGGLPEMKEAPMEMGASITRPSLSSTDSGEG